MNSGLKYAAALSLLVFLSSCDPFYHMGYMVKNTTTDPVYIKYMNYPDSLVKVNPGWGVEIIRESGVGYAKKKFRDKHFQDWFDKNAIIVRKFPDNSMKKVSETEWKYEGKRRNGVGILYVKK